MLRTLNIKDRHTGCTRCNYTGCLWLREKHPIMGHWIWAITYTYRNIVKAIHWTRVYNWYCSLDYSRIENIELDGIDTRDYPDFCDAYISSATYKGRDMTDLELDRLNEDRDFVYNKVLDRLY